MVEYIRDLKPRIIIIRLLKSIGVGNIVATIVVMTGVLAFMQGHFHCPLFRNSTNL